MANKNQKEATLSWDVSGAELGVIAEIAHRAAAMKVCRELGYDFKWAMMDLQATHANGTPLRLDDLLKADDFNFSHDILGIRRHLDRKTGKLGGFFSPRFSR